MEMLTRENGGVLPGQDSKDILLLDLPPEYCSYEDEGCNNYPSCLNCPFPRCLYEEPHGRQQWIKKVRRRKKCQGTGFDLQRQ